MVSSSAWILPRQLTLVSDHKAETDLPESIAAKMREINQAQAALRERMEGASHDSRIKAKSMEAMMEQLRAEHKREIALALTRKEEHLASDHKLGCAR